MKRLFPILSLFLCLILVPSVKAQFTTVSATVVDPNSVPYANCHVSASFVPSPTATTQALIAGSTFQTVVPAFQCDSFGHFSVTLVDNTQVSDGHSGGQTSKWSFSVTSGPGYVAGPYSFTYTAVISGTTMDISAALKAAAAPFPALSSSFSGITSGTNTSANMVVGTGASLTTSGSGTITANGAPFSGLTGGTNTTAAMLVGTGASLGPTGSGTLTASTMPWAGLTSFPSGCTNQVITAILLTPTCTSLTTAFLPTTGTWAFGGTLSGNMTESGNNVYTGTDTFSSINGIVFVDGVTYPLTQTGVQNAINQACTNNFNQGGTVRIKGGTINLASQTGQLLLSPCPLTIEGDGGETTFFQVATGISSAIPVFRLKVTNNTLFYEIKNIEVVCTSGCPTAGDAFLIDSGGGSNPGPSAVRFEHVRVTNGSLNGFDVNETGSGTNFQFEHHLQDNYFESGGVNINTVSADEQFIEHDLFNMGNAANPCISMTQQAGAAHALVLGNWMACGGGYVVIHQATQPQIVFDQMDSGTGQVGCTETNSSMVDVIGDIGAVYGAQIHNNNLNAHTFCHNNIQFGANSTNWLVMANALSINTTNSVGACGINIVSGGTGGVIGPNIWFPGGTGYSYVCGDTAAAHVRLFANSATGEPDTRAIAPSDTDQALVIRANSPTQSAALMHIQNSAGGVLADWDKAGNYVSANGAQASCIGTGIGFQGNTNSGLNYFTASNLIQGCINGTSLFAETAGSFALGSGQGFAWASTADPISAAPDTGVARNAAGVVSADTTSPGNALGKFKATGYLPVSAGGADLGSTALPFGNLWLGTAATNNFKFAPAVTSAQRIVTLNDPGAAVNLPFTNNSDTTTTHVLHATATGNVFTSSAIATGDLPTAIPIGNIGTSGLSGTSPVTINAAGAIGCATCVTSAAALTSNAVVIGGGSQASSTISADTTTTHALFATGTSPAFRALATGDMPATVVQTGQVNTGAAAMTLNMAASTTANSFVAPAQAGLTSGTNGAIAYDTTNNNTHIRTNAADSIAVAEATALAANVIPKQTDATHGLVSASLVSDNGTALTYTGTGGVLSSGNNAILTTDFTDTSSASLQNVTGLNFTLPANTARNYEIDCNLMWSQATFSGITDQFGLQDVTVAPTRIDGYGLMSVAGPGAVITNAIYGVLTNLTTTTATAIVSAIPTVATINFAQLHFTVQQPSNASTSVLQIMVSQSTAADVIVVRAGSSCRLN
jgi:hypothetical protein